MAGFFTFDYDGHLYRESTEPRYSETLLLDVPHSNDESYEVKSSNYIKSGGNLSVDIFVN
jgi:hypothetical protein